MRVVAGDTKVLRRGEGGGLYLATTGVGVRAQGLCLGMEHIRAGDRIVVSGPVGDHGIAVLLAVFAVVTTLWRRSVLEARRAEAAKLLALGEVELDPYPTAALAWATASLELSDTLEGRLLALRALHSRLGDGHALWPSAGFIECQLGGDQIELGPFTCPPITCLLLPCRSLDIAARPR
mgnify:CR=1 FL=1